MTTEGQHPANDRDSRLQMARGIGQVLYGYLPGKTFDYEEGRAICQATAPLVTDLEPLSPDTAEAVMDDVADYLGAWEALGGGLADFPDQTRHRDQYLVAEPRQVRWRLFPLTYHCASCWLMRTYQNSAQVSGLRHPRECPNCHRLAMRQLHQVFVHGCGRMEPVRPLWLRWDDAVGRAVEGRRWCASCQSADYVGLDLRGERAKDFRWICVRCQHQLPYPEVTMNCPDCFARAHRTPGQSGARPDASLFNMRLIPHQANPAFYPHMSTLLDIRDPSVSALAQTQDGLAHLGAALIGNDHAAALDDTTRAMIASLREQAERQPHNRPQIEATIGSILRLPASQPPSSAAAVALPESLARGAAEAVAMRHNLTFSWLHGAPEGNTSETLAALGIHEMALCEDFPIVTASFGFTRRSFEPTYRDGERDHHTILRSFDAIQQSRRGDFSEHAGKRPVLATRIETEGVYVRLSARRIAEWLTRARLWADASDDANEPQAQARILAALQAPDRFYERLDDMPVTRSVFTLLHTVSHVALSVLAGCAGLEPSSLCEYLLLPDLSFVIYAPSTGTSLGALRAVCVDRFAEFAMALATQECLRCVYDPQCAERTGSCHGCVFLPETSCRAFNRGLSRTVLRGGHNPWSRPGSCEMLEGYWSVPQTQSVPAA